MDWLLACGLGGQPFLDHVGGLGGGLVPRDSISLGQVVALAQRCPVGKYGLQKGLSVGGTKGSKNSADT